MQLTNKEIVKRLADLKRVKADFDVFVIQVQIDCLHDHIAEWDTAASAPLRVCLHCGLTEEGWGCGFIVLKNKTELGVPTIDQKRYYELRQGAYIRDDDKGPLLRKEITLEALISKKGQ
jgi:hypothetical protein